MSTTVRLSHTMSPEAAEAAVDQALTRHPHTNVMVRLNGFSGARFKVIASRLPHGYTVRSVGPNVRMIVEAKAAADPTSLTVYAANFDWANRVKADATDARQIVAHGASVILGVELASAGHPTTHLAELLPHGWHVHQGKGAAAKTAVAVAPGHRLGAAGSHLGIGHVPGVKLGVRDIEWQDVFLDGRRVRTIAVHEPPHRFHSLWPIYTANLVAVVRTSPFPVIVGGDWNAKLSGVDVHKLARVLGLKVYGDGIDGILYSKSLVATPAPTVTNAATRSDHPFPGATFTWAA